MIDKSGTQMIGRESWQRGSTISDTTGTTHGGKLAYEHLGDHGNAVPSENAPWKRGVTSQSTHTTSSTTTTTGKQFFRNGSQLQIGDRVSLLITSECLCPSVFGYV